MPRTIEGTIRTINGVCRTNDRVLSLRRWRARSVGMPAAVAAEIRSVS
ncbi:MAG: hypothetical protein JO020_01365 [Chloroflexi bacterium]|nr:hypothetical protein [Chloroflexota bacterium]